MLDPALSSQAALTKFISRLALSVVRAIRNGPLVRLVLLRTFLAASSRFLLDELLVDLLRALLLRQFPSFLSGFIVLCFSSTGNFDLLGLRR